IARKDAVTFVAVPLVFGLLSSFVQTDLVIYRLYRAHVNGMVLNLLSTPGGNDSFTLGRGTAISGALLFVAILSAHVGIAWLVVRRALAGDRRTAVSRGVRWAWAALAIVVLADKAVFAWADFNGYAAITRVSRLIPLYRPVGLKEFL